MSQLVFLDQATLPDVDLSPLQQLQLPLRCYPHTTPDEVLERLADATVAIVNKVVLNAAMVTLRPIGAEGGPVEDSAALTFTTASGVNTTSSSMRAADTPSLAGQKVSTANTMPALSS